MGREEIIGYDGGNDAENIIGALLNMARTPGAWRQPAPGRMLAPPTAGVRAGSVVQGPAFTAQQVGAQVGAQRDARLRAPLGLGFFTYDSTTGLTHTFEVEPQEAFRGSRMIITAVPSAAGVGGVGVVSSIFVGSMPQTPSTQHSLPLSMFAPDTTDAQMDWQVCPAGTKILVTVAFSTAIAAESEVAVAIGIYGEWIR